MEENKIAWSAVIAVLLGLLALVCSVLGIAGHSPWLMAHAGVVALLAITAAILSLKE